jgi:diguanylate cyclase
MNAPATLQTPIERVTAWFRRPSDHSDQVESIDPRLVRRTRYDDVGDFLFANDLSLTGANFDFAQRFLAGEDAMLAREVQALLDRKARLSDRDVSRLQERRAADPASDTLGTMARELEAKVAECLAAVSDSTASTTAYSTALDAAADEMAADPGNAYRRLLEITLEVAETTRRIGGRLERTRRDTRRLRADLDDARRAAEEDELTGLPNRRGFYTRVEEALGASKSAGLAVALCDIDDFKAINDRHGHDTGDRVLRFVARLLRDALPRQVFVARYGGEEFVCLFEGVEVPRAIALLDAARVKLGDRVLRDQNSDAPIGSVTFSAGVAVLGDDTAAALRVADEALYFAKNTGKDRVAAG